METRRVNIGGITGAPVPEVEISIPSTALGKWMEWTKMRAGLVDARDAFEDSSFVAINRGAALTLAQGEAVSEPP